MEVPNRFAASALEPFAIPETDAVPKIETESGTTPRTFAITTEVPNKVAEIKLKPDTTISSEAMDSTPIILDFTM